MNNTQLHAELAEINAGTRKSLSKAVVNSLGSFDNASRFFLEPEFATDSSDAIRTPSRAWPFSIYKHAFTAKYARQLAAKIAA